jgi:aspartyl-tRNA(Asn)/glutamyl-tRNA(Gln) amidotransferase subunit B
MSDYRPTIGLEIHAELNTRTKMFCNSRNSPRELRPNVNICPVCMAHPGTLPVINKEAVAHVVRMGTAVGGTIADYTEFDRKNYFYPDIPKGYQISQYQYPLVTGGTLAGVQITRVHLEEDTARSQHTSTTLSASEGGKTLIDYNRAGVPLMELVTEPVIHDAATAGKFARELQMLLRTLGASEANMEEGQMRVEANISISKDDTFGTKVEIKNLNSFRAVERAIAYEVERQAALIEGGGKVTQETRGWDDSKGVTFAQRKKESSHDYRYFPDPDLPKLQLSLLPEFAPEVVRASLPELPWEKRERYFALGLKAEDAEMFVRELHYGMFFDAVAALLTKKEDILVAVNYLTSDVAGIITADATKASWLIVEENATRFAALIQLLAEGKVSSRGAKNILAHMFESTDTPEAIAEREGLYQKSDSGELLAVVRGVIDANPKVVAEYKAGKEASLQFLIGQAMKATKGSANPSMLKELFAEALK